MENELQTLENLKNDSNKYHSVMRNLQNKGKKKTDMCKKTQMVN